jgi:CheY-like chemotaxis protein
VLSRHGRLGNPSAEDTPKRGEGPGPIRSAGRVRATLRTDPLASTMSADDDRIEFVADASALPPSLLHETPWIVLIVDDDEDVHQATLLGLQGVQILGRPLHFLHAYTAAQAETLLGAHQDVAVVLLDVVMEDSHAGLSLVHRIRRDLKLANPRIVLRTGQPGYAPEIEAIRDYDINDYKTKGELTRNKLYTALTSAIRAYEQIRQLDESRRGLELIIRASTQFVAEDHPAGGLDRRAQRGPGVRPGRRLPGHRRRRPLCRADPAPAHRDRR